MKDKEKNLKSATLTLRRVYEDKTFEGKGKRWVLISEDDVFYSYFGDWEKKKVTAGDKVKVFFTETKKGGKVFRNVKDWKVIQKVMEKEREFEESFKSSNYHLRLEALNKAIEITKITGKEKNVLKLANKIKEFLGGSISHQNKEQ